MTPACSHCDPSHLDDPSGMLEQLRQRGLLAPGPDLVVVMTNRTSEILGCDELPQDLESDWGGELVAAAAQRAGAGPWEPRGPKAKTRYLIRRRTGRTVPLPHDFAGWTSWLNASNWTDCYAGDWFLVTDHGWRSLLGSHGPAAVQPRLTNLRLLPSG